MQNNIITYDHQARKKAHQKLFDKVLLQLKSNNKVHKQKNAITHAHNAHKKAFNKVLMQIKSNNKVHKQNNAGHKDSSANTEVNNNHDILPDFNKIKKIKKVLSEHIKNIMSTFNKVHDNKRIRLNQLKKINSNANMLFDSLAKHFFNKKIIYESIIENTNVTKNIKKYIKIIDNKLVCIANIEQYLYDVVDDIHDKIKNKKHNDAHTELLKIKKYTMKPMKDMCNYHANKKTNKKTTKNKKINKDNSASKKITIDNSTNKKVTIDNSINRKINTNKKIIKAHNANIMLTTCT